MRLAWFTPFSSRSAIGHYSRLVTEALSERGHAVDIWTTCEGELHPTTLAVRSFSSHQHVSLREIAAYDLCVYQIGNYWPFHGEIWLLSQQHPGLVVLHDCVLHGLFAGYFFEHLRDPDRYVKSLAHWHGPAAAVQADEFLQGRRGSLWEGDDVSEFPLLAPATWGALGVVGHSRFVVGLAQRDYAGPAAVLPLPYEGRNAAKPEARGGLGLRDDQLLLLTLGHVNPNKRVLQVIQALGQISPALRDRVVYAVLGPVGDSHQAELRAEAERCGLGERVRLPGYVSDGELRQHLLHADLCLTLRHPNTEGASASLVEQMLAGRPVVVSDTGCFAELPPTSVWHVRRDREIPDLVVALTTLLGQPERRRELGREARAYALKTFSADQYAEGVELLADNVLRLRPLSDLCSRMGEHLRHMGAKPSGPWETQVAAEAGRLFAGAASELLPEAPLKRGDAFSS